MSDSGSLGDGGKLLFCSFCGKNQNEVRRLIAAVKERNFFFKVKEPKKMF